MEKRPFRLWLYLLVVCALSWPFQVLSALGPRTLAWMFAMNGLSMVMVGVGTFVCARFVFRDGLAGAGWRWGPGRWYVVAGGLAVLIWGTPAGIDLALGNLHLPTALPWGKVAWLGTLLGLVFIPAFGEEIGWHGYMLPHLARRMRSPRAAVAWHGVIWGLWHFPLLAGSAAAVIPGHQHGAAAVAAAIGVGAAAGAFTIFLGAIFAWLWTRSGSIAVVTVLHAAYDGVRDSLAVTLGSGPSEGYASLITLVIGALVLWGFRWTALRKAAGGTPSP